LNNHRVEDANTPVTLSDLVEGHFLVLRRGRKNYHLIKVLR
jgi:tyrosyl-tRNA synthetase